VPSDISIPTVALSVILGNTFDNSIEECLALDNENREIDVSLIQKNNMLLYEIKNPCTEPLRKKTGNHFGYGLKNIRAYVDKNSGFFQSSVKNGYYCVSVRLNCSGKINAYNS
jgi:sensor histidine kinase regulating citrate/malate metabolism